MRSFLIGMAVLGMSLAMFAAVEAGGEKETTLKGKITCAKCDLMVEKKCATVIVTKENGKDVTVYFDAKGNKKYHGETCMEAKMGSVTGVVSMDGAKKIITVTAVKYE